MLGNLFRLTLAAVIVGFAMTLRPSEQASAIVHLAEIHEIMVGFDGDPDVQYIEINMRLGGQNITNGSHLSAFDATGAFIDGDPGTAGNQPLITFVGNVPNGGDGVRWIVGTTEFEAVAGIQADFVIPATPGMPTNAGMVCLFEAFENFTNPSRSVDCISYGGANFTGTNPNSSPSEAALTGPGDGEKSLTRINPATFPQSFPPWAHSDLANDFELRCPTPENNAGEIALLGDDDDGDGLPNCHEIELGTDPMDPDTDGDGCMDGAELGPDETLGGLRDPLNPWDFYDVAGPGPSLPPDQRVDLPNDILPVILNYTGNAGYAAGEPAAAGTPGTVDLYDRGPSSGPHPWNMTAPDLKIDLPNDILAVILQFGHDCR